MKYSTKMLMNFRLNVRLIFECLFRLNSLNYRRQRITFILTKYFTKIDLTTIYFRQMFRYEVSVSC